MVFCMYSLRTNDKLLEAMYKQHATKEYMKIDHAL